MEAASVMEAFTHAVTSAPIVEFCGASGVRLIPGMCRVIQRTGWKVLVAAIVAASAALASCGAFAADGLATYLSKAAPSEFFPGATASELAGRAAYLPVYADDKLLGYVYLNSDFTASIGYSGKPVRMLVGIDTKAYSPASSSSSTRSPSCWSGFPRRRVVEAVNKLIGTRIERDRGAARSARRSPTSSAAPRSPCS